MTTVTSIMEWCSAYCSLTVWVTSLFIDEVLDYIQMATKTSNVDCHITIIVNAGSVYDHCHKLDEVVFDLQTLVILDHILIQ